METENKAPEEKTENKVPEENKTGDSQMANEEAPEVSPE